MVLIIGIFLASKDNRGQTKETENTPGLPQDATPFSPYSRGSKIQSPIENNFVSPPIQPTAPSTSQGTRQGNAKNPNTANPQSQSNGSRSQTGSGEVVSPSLPTQPNYVLSLPTVTYKDLVIDQNGVSNFAAYLDQFMNLARNVTFPVEKYNSILKDENGITLSPERLVEKALKEKSFTQIGASIAITKEFEEYKIQKMKEIKVKDQGAVINATLIGFEKLVIEMLDKALLVEKGEITESDFDKYYQKYNESASYYFDQFLNSYGDIASRPKTFLGKIADVFGMRKIARAIALLPFGGMITVTVPCTCSIGMTIVVGPPVGGKFFVSAFGSRILANFRPFSGSWIIGNYVPGTIPCLQISFPACVPQVGGENQGPVAIAGTS